MRGGIKKGVYSAGIFFRHDANIFDFKFHLIILKYKKFRSYSKK